MREDLFDLSIQKGGVSIAAAGSRAPHRPVGPMACRLSAGCGQSGRRDHSVETLAGLTDPQQVGSNGCSVQQIRDPLIAPRSLATKKYSLRKAARPSLKPRAGLTFLGCDTSSCLALFVVSPAAPLRDQPPIKSTTQSQNHLLLFSQPLQ